VYSYTSTLFWAFVACSAVSFTLTFIGCTQILVAQGSDSLCIEGIGKFGKVEVVENV
jgi:hypothetical protein